MFDKYQDKVNQISSKVKEVISEFIQTNDFSENLELNLDDFISITSQYESMNISKDDFVSKIFKLLSQK